MQDEIIPREFKGVWIPKEIWLDEVITPLQKMMLAEIISLSKDGKGCYASNAYLARFLRQKEKTIKNNLTELRELGWIRDISFDGRTRFFDVVTGRQMSRNRDGSSPATGIQYPILDPSLDHKNDPPVSSNPQSNLNPEPPLAPPPLPVPKLRELMETSKNPKGKSWVARAVAIWAEHQGVIGFPMTGKALKPVVEAIGEEAMLAAFEKYARTSESQYMPNVFKFATTYLKWLPPKEKQKGGMITKDTVMPHERPSVHADDESWPEDMLTMNYGQKTCRYE